MGVGKLIWGSRRCDEEKESQWQALGAHPLVGKETQIVRLSEWREERATRKDNVRSCCPGGGDCQRMLDSQSNATEAEAIIVEGGYQAVTMVEL